jgi:membrane protein YdbS with pleckstrin-like domain
LGTEVGVKVIKPPIERVTSGKIFKPSKAFLHKLIFKAVNLAVDIWIIAMICFVLFSHLLAFSEPQEYAPASMLIGEWIAPVGIGVLVLNLIWLIPVLIFTPSYVRSIEYSVKAESGETMPEIYVKKGIVTVTRKHVPFRTITNISSKAGPFDRMFGIGSVHIETAGQSDSNKAGPEEILEGVVFYEEVRDFILNELRKFRAPYVLGTEVVYKTDKPATGTEGLDDEILSTLREIREILRSQRTERDRGDT